MNCTKEHLARLSGAICNYDGYLTGFALPAGSILDITERANSLGLSIEMDQEHIEFSFKGRDSNLFVIDFLKYLAQRVGTALGEVRCEITTDERDPLFEFFRFREGKLIAQKGRIVRDSEMEMG
jgi:hypothetical protein